MKNDVTAKFQGSKSQRFKKKRFLKKTFLQHERIKGTGTG
jgi:hypothetical protein